MRLQEVANQLAFADPARKPRDRHHQIVFLKSRLLGRTAASFPLSGARCRTQLKSAIEINDCWPADTNSSPIRSPRGTERQSLDDPLGHELVERASGWESVAASASEWKCLNYCDGRPGSVLVEIYDIDH